MGEGRRSMAVIRLLVHQVIPGIDKGTAAAKLKVQVGSGGSPGAAHSANDVALIDALSADRVNCVEVGIEGLEAVAMINDNHIAVSPVVPAGIYHHAIIHCINRVSQPSRNINSPVIGLR